MKKTKTLSRKRRALRRVLIAAAALFLVNRIFVVGLLFPIQAVRHNEELMGTGRTEVVRRDWDPSFHWDFVAYLTKSENIVMLSGARLTLYGWMSGFGRVVDCTEESPIHGGTWFLNWGARSVIYVFGRVDDPDITELNVQWTIAGDADSDMWIASKTGEWIEEDGRRYFLCSYTNANAADYRLPQVVGRDKEGNEIARVKLEQGASSSYG